MTWTCTNCGLDVNGGGTPPLNLCPRCGGTAWQTIFAAAGSALFASAGMAIVGRDPLRDALSSIVVLARDALRTAETPASTLLLIEKVAIDALTAAEILTRR